MRGSWVAGLLGCAMVALSGIGTGASAKPATEQPAAASGTRVVATINLSAQNMTVAIDGRIAHTWAISSGAAGFETPTGSFRPQWAAKMHFSKKYDDAPMPHSVFFNGGVATHGTSSIGRLGSPASHGCIRLAPNNAATFFAIVHQYGFQATRITVRGTTPAVNIARARGFDTRYASSDRYQRRVADIEPYQGRNRRVVYDSRYDARYGGQPRYVLVSPQPRYLFGNW